MAHSFIIIGHFISCHTKCCTFCTLLDHWCLSFSITGPVGVEVLKYDWQYVTDSTNPNHFQVLQPAYGACPCGTYEYAPASLVIGVVMALTRHTLELLVGSSGSIRWMLAVSLKGMAMGAIAICRNACPCYLPRVRTLRGHHIVFRIALIRRA
jgi:hypothetical protein